MSTGRGAERSGEPAVACRLVIDGRVIEFALAGPLVSMAPAAEKTAKRPTRRRAAR